MGELFKLLAYFYIGVGVFTLVRVIKNWRSLWDDKLTADDARLASRAAFFVLIPPAVMLHELGHAVLIWAYGLHVDDWLFLGYLGEVLPSGSAGAVGDFWIALAGNLVSVVLALGAIGYAFWRPGHPTRNILLIEFGRQLMFAELVAYPMLSVGSGWGDFRWIYGFHDTPIASGVVAAIHALAVLVIYPRWWLRIGRPRALVLCSGISSGVLDLERRIAKDPNDRSALIDLGLLAAQLGSHRQARRHLEAALAGAAVDAPPGVRLALAQALLETGEPARALEEIEKAGPRIFAPEARTALDFLTARALIAAGRGEEAVAFTTALRAREPANVAWTSLWGKAMIAAGRKAEARVEIEALLDKAQGAEQRVLRRLLDEVR